MAVHLPLDPTGGYLVNTLELKALEVRQFEGFRLFRLPEKIIITEAIGAPLAGIAIERLIVSGMKKIILLGLAGSLVADFRIGDAALVTEALSAEGTSRHYFPREKTFFASTKMHILVERKLTRLGLPYRRTKVISTDAPFRETRSWLNQARRQGAALVDMETSAELAIASFHDVAAAVILLVSDELFGRRWKAGFSSPLLRQAAERYFLPFLVEDLKEPS
ncbi:MAG: phosphorylase family protein [Candidatus Aminicenantales bacterium]